MRTLLKEPAILLLTAVLILLTIGLVVILSSTFFLQHKESSYTYYYFQKHLMLLCLGLILLIISLNISSLFLKRITIVFFVLSLILLGLVFIPGIGKQSGGATRWINLRFLTFQPSELVKLTSILFVSYYLSLYPKIKFQHVLILYSALGIPLLLIGLQPDFGTAFHLGITLFTLLLFTQFPKFILLISTFLIVPILYYSIINVNWRLDRLKAFLDPWKYRYDEGYQLIQSFKSFSIGGLLGKDLINDTTYHSLIASHTDFILAVIGEVFGFIGVFLTISIFLFIIIYTLFQLKSIQNEFNRNLGFGIIFLFMYQVLIHIGVNLGALPTTGITLPLISYGGSSLFLYLFIFGILFNIISNNKEHASL